MAGREGVMAARTLRTRLQHLYFGTSEDSTRFRFALLALDVLTIALFILASFVHEAWWIAPLDLVFAALIFADFAARLYAAPHRWRHLFSLETLADLAVLASLVLPAFVENLAFLRVVRAVALLRSRHLRRDLAKRSAWFRVNEAVIQRTLTLAVFIFVVTAAVYVTQHRYNPEIRNYIDALYFTVTTLTTTGFGDIVLRGWVGRLLSVFIMVVGVSLFLRLLQALFRPRRVRFTCPDCGLKEHEIDAVHCKHCGRVLNIPNESFV